MIRLVVFCFFSSLATLEAQIPNVLALAPYGQFIANMDNYVFIVMQKDEPLKAEEIIAEFSRMRYGPTVFPIRSNMINSFTETSRSKMEHSVMRSE